jgi:hypothetical protein
MYFEVVHWILEVDNTDLFYDTLTISLLSPCGDWDTCNTIAHKVEYPVLLDTISLPFPH